MDPVHVEHSVTAKRSAAEVWKELSALKGLMMPGFVEGFSVSGDPRTQRIKFTGKAWMDQEMIEKRDDAMQMRMKMIGGQGIPWSDCESTFRVEPTGPAECVVSVRCIATPTAEPRLVEGMLRDSFMLGLAHLKREME